jgi:hypothetical protein
MSIYVLNPKNPTINPPLNNTQQQYVNALLQQIKSLDIQDDISVYIRLNTNTLCINSKKKKDAGLTFVMIDLPKNLQIKNLNLQMVACKLLYELALREDNLEKAFFIFNNYCKPYFKRLQS